jgi:CheY-like chemotaxis protein
VVYGIVESCKGSIHVYSDVGKGSTFKVYLPAIIEHVEPEKQIIEDIPTGNETILFVDDEVLLVDLAEGQLRTLGYDVTTCSCSIEALKLFESNPDAFDIVITDLTMPKMSGTDFAKTIRHIRSDIPIILCSGFSSSAAADDASGHDFDSVLMKPIIIRDMANGIRKLLDSEA